MIRPPAPFFSPSSRGRPIFGVGNPKNCSGYVGLAAGFPGTYRILVRDLPGLRDNPKNCSGYCTRQVLGKQPGILYLEKNWRSRQPGNKRNNCSGYWAMTRWKLPGPPTPPASPPGHKPNNCSPVPWNTSSGFGLRGFGIGDRDICIYTLIYIHIIHTGSPVF